MEKLVALSLLAEVGHDRAQDGARPPVYRVLREVSRWAGMVGWDGCPMVFSSMAELERIHGVFAEAFSPTSLRTLVDFRPPGTPEGCLWVYEEEYVGIAENDSPVLRGAA